MRSALSLCLLALSACAAVPTRPLADYPDVAYVSPACRAADVRIGVVRYQDGSGRFALESKDIRLESAVNVLGQAELFQIERRSSADPSTALAFVLRCALMAGASDPRTSLALQALDPRPPASDAMYNLDGKLAPF